MGQIKCVIFDKDGTLLDFGRCWIPVAEQAVDLIGTAYGASAAVRAEMMAGIGVRDGHADIKGPLCYGTYGDIARAIGAVLAGQGIPFDPTELAESTARAFACSADAGEMCPTTPDLRDCLEAMKGRGLRLFVVTSDRPELAAFCLDQLGMHGLFEEVLADDGVHPGKPNPYYIRYLREKYGFELEEMCMVGDTPTDLRFAANGGIRGFGVGETQEARRILALHAAAVASSVAELERDGRFDV